MEAIVCVNPAGDIVTVNRMTESMFGYSEAELKGMPLSILLPEHERGRQARQLSAFLAKPQARVTGLGDLRGRRRDGTEFPTEITITAIQASEVPQAVAFISDVTDRRHS